MEISLFYWPAVIFRRWHRLCLFGEVEFYCFSWAFCNFSAKLALFSYSCSGGMNGYFIISDKPVQPVEIDSPIDGMDMIVDNKVLYVTFTSLLDWFKWLFFLPYLMNLCLCLSRSVFYKCPPFHAHIPRPPEGVHYPKKV